MLPPRGTQASTSSGPASTCAHPQMARAPRCPTARVREHFWQCAHGSGTTVKRACTHPRTRVWVEAWVKASVSVEASNRQLSGSTGSTGSLAAPILSSAAGAELASGLSVAEGEIRVIKKRFSAFFATHLDLMLRCAACLSSWWVQRELKLACGRVCLGATRQECAGWRVQRGLVRGHPEGKAARTRLDVA